MFAVIGSIVLALAACGGGSNEGGGPPPPPPASVSAAPGNGQAMISWPASAGATSYNVYYATSAAVSTGSPKVSAAGTSAPVTGLVNGTAYWFAVTAVNGSGESSLSPVGCAVPTAANQAGLTLRDSLCGSALSGATWWPNGLYSLQVSGGEAALSARMDSMESYSTNGAQYGVFTIVNAGSSRVTTLRADIRVPAASAARTGSDARIRAGIRLLYSPPASRLNFPGAYQDLLNFEVGLVDLGSGLVATRQLTHCDNPSCSSFSPSGITFVDPAGFTAVSTGEQSGAPAAYDTTYTVQISLAETEGTVGVGVFHWSIAGGSFGAGVTGTANPATYLAGAAEWAGIPLSGAGFFMAQLSARVLDRSAAGGGAARVTGNFDNVWVGTNDGAAALYDDFSGTSGNSGPTEFSLAKWASTGAASVGLVGGALAIHHQATSSGASVSFGHGLTLANPAAVNAIQADITVPSHAAGASISTNAFVQGRFYNDGTAGAAPNSAVGDVLAGVFLQAATNSVMYLVGRCLTPTCTGALGAVATGTFPGATVDTGTHTVLVKWDPAARRFTFALDGNAITVDPTASAPFARPANAPLRRIFASVGVPATAGATGSIDARVNNVFTAP